jgi:hypothetical protein
MSCVTPSCQAIAQHFQQCAEFLPLLQQCAEFLPLLQQCAEFLPLRNRALGPLAMTVYLASHRCDV